MVSRMGPVHRGARVVPDVAPTTAGGLSGTSRVVAAVVVGYLGLD